MKTIYNVWEQQGWEDPEVDEQYAPDRAILKLSFHGKQMKTSSDKDASSNINGDKKIRRSSRKQKDLILNVMES